MWARRARWAGGHDRPALRPALRPARNALVYRLSDREPAAAAQLHVTSAGVLPVFAWEGEVVFLLGQEGYVHNWSGSMQWSAFSGGSKAGETERGAAAREFIEESMGLLGSDQAAVERMLATYEMRVVVVARDVVVPVSRTLFVKRFWAGPGGPARLADRFDASRAQLLELEAAAARVRALGARFPAGYPYLVEGHRLRGPGRPDEVVLRVLEARAAGGAVWLHAHTRCGRTRTVLCLGCDPAEARAFAEWLRQREELDEALRQPLARELACALDVRRGEGGVLLGVRVRRDFLEKRRVLPVTLSDLQKVVQSGILEGSAVRPSFLPVLGLVCEQFVAAAQAAGAAPGF